MADPSPAPVETDPLLADPAVVGKSKLLDALHGDPKTRPKLLGLIKEYAPHLRIPEIDIAKGVETEVVEPLRKEVGELRTELTKARDERETERAWGALVREGLITEADIPEVETLMTEKKIGDRRFAAEHLAQSRRVAAPRTFSGRTLELGTVPDVKLLYGNPAKWARQEADRYLAERGGRR